MSINNKQWLGLPLNLLWGYIAIAVFMTGDGFELAFLSHYIKALGFSPAEASFAFTLYGLAAALSAWISGVVAEIITPLKTMMIGFVLWCVFHVLFLVFGLGHANYALILLFYGIRGFAYPLFLYSFIVAIVHNVKSDNASSAIGWFWAVYSIGIGVFGSYIPSFTIPHIGEMGTLWLALAMCSFWGAAQAHSRSGKILGYVLLGVACGMGVMTKGFLALAVPVVGVLPWVIARKRWREVLTYGWLAVIVCTLVVLPWGLAIAQREPDFWRYFFWVEHIQRFAEKDAQHKAPFWYYIPFLIAGSLPWLALLPGALKRGWLERDEARGALYLLGWVAMPFLFFSIAKGKLPTYILPCFAPLSILMARYALEAAKTGAKALRINGMINLGVGLLGLIAVLVVSPWAFMHKPVWTKIELYKCLLAAIAFAVWALMGWLAMKDSGRRWSLAALCPLGLALLVGFAIPDRVIDSKQPQFLVDIVSESLQPSRYVLTNNVGIAGGLAWELKRSDIIMFDKQGELKYGLDWPDAQGSFVSQAGFADWLAAHRQQGPVSLVLLMDKGESMLDLPLPKPDNAYELGRVVFLQYLPQ